jgi:hypothetical protein
MGNLMVVVIDRRVRWISTKILRHWDALFEVRLAIILPRQCCFELYTFCGGIPDSYNVPQFSPIVLYQLQLSDERRKMKYLALVPLLMKAKRPDRET